MDCTLQKADIRKRASAYLFDFILLGILATFFAWLLSIVLNYNGYNERMTDYYSQYESLYGIDFRITEEEYSMLSDLQKAAYQEANTAMNQNGELLYTYRMLFNLMLITATVSIFLAHLVLEFFVPFFLGNGQTMGKRIFGIAVMRTEGLRLTPPVLFIRAILGKYTVEVMVPVFLLLLTAFGNFGMVGLASAALVGLLNPTLMGLSHTNSALHDLLADTVTVELASQQIFENREELVAHQKTLHTAEIVKHDR